MSHYLISNSYQRVIFWPLWFLSVILTVFISGIIYLVFAQQVFKNSQQELMQIAQKTSYFIPAETHERLQQPGDQDSEDYNLLELYLQSIMAGNPKIDDIYTLRPTNKPHEMVFVISGKETEDSDKNGIIEDFEMKAALGEKYDTTDFPDLEKGFYEPAFDQEITYDKWGAWLSGYAPLKNQNGRSVAIVGVDFSADTIAKQRHDILNVFLIINAILILPYALLSFYVSRLVSRPYNLLIEGIGQVKRGDFNYRLKSGEKGLNKIVADFFNEMQEEYQKILERKSKKK